MLESTDIPDCFIVNPPVRKDARGAFVKPYQTSVVGDFSWREIYWSVSAKDVLRGMHFQTPPAEHHKLVWCTTGAVVDVVVDLRSTNYGAVISTHLDGDNGRALLIPPGCAHGFLSLADATTMVYAVTSEYDAEHDSGVKWDSIDFDWPVDQPSTSDRDAAFAPLAEFESPFD